MSKKGREVGWALSNALGAALCIVGIHQWIRTLNARVCLRCNTVKKMQR